MSGSFECRRAFPSPCGIHPSIVTASLRTVINAVNRAHALRAQREEAAAAFD